MQCNRCKTTLQQGEEYSFHGETVCYMDLTNPPKACDPMAVASALNVRKEMGQKGIEGLTEQQQKICRIIQKKGKITKQDLAAAAGIKPEELEREFAVLRHCELIRAFKEGSTTYLTKW